MSYSLQWEKPTRGIRGKKVLQKVKGPSHFGNIVQKFSNGLYWGPLEMVDIFKGLFPCNRLACYYPFINPASLTTNFCRISLLDII